MFAKIALLIYYNIKQIIVYFEKEKKNNGIIWILVVDFEWCEIDTQINEGLVFYFLWWSK